MSNSRKINNRVREDSSRMKILTRISSYKSKLRKVIIIIILQNSFCKQSYLTLKWEVLEVPQSKAIVLTGGDIKSKERQACNVWHSTIWQNLQRLYVTTRTCSTNSVHKQKMWINGSSFSFIHCIKSVNPKAVDNRILTFFILKMFYCSAFSIFFHSESISFPYCSNL